MGRGSKIAITIPWAKSALEPVFWRYPSTLHCTFGCRGPFRGAVLLCYYPEYSTGAVCSATDHIQTPVVPAPLGFSTLGMHRGSSSIEKIIADSVHHSCCMHPYFFKLNTGKCLHSTR